MLSFLEAKNQGRPLHHANRSDALYRGQRWYSARRTQRESRNSVRSATGGPCGGVLLGERGEDFVLGAQPEAAARVGTERYDEIADAVDELRKAFALRRLLLLGRHLVVFRKGRPHGREVVRVVKTAAAALAEERDGEDAPALRIHVRAPAREAPERTALRPLVVEEEALGALLRHDERRALRRPARQHDAAERARRLVLEAHARIQLLVDRTARIAAGGEGLAVLGGDRAISDTSAKRYEGCVEAFRKNGLTFDDETMYYTGRYSYEFGYNGMKQVLRERKDFTAVFAMADVIAIGAIRALFDEGLRVPEDISVAGYDGLRIGSYFVPKLTTIAQSVDLLAECSFDLLLSCMQGAQAQHLTVPFRLLTRQSVRQITEIEG